MTQRKIILQLKIVRYDKKKNGISTEREGTRFHYDSSKINILQSHKDHFMWVKK